MLRRGATDPAAFGNIGRSGTAELSDAAQLIVSPGRTDETAVCMWISDRALPGQSADYWTDWTFWRSVRTWKVRPAASGMRGSVKGEIAGTPFAVTASSVTSRCPAGMSFRCPDARETSPAAAWPSLPGARAHPKRLSKSNCCGGRRARLGTLPGECDSRGMSGRVITKSASRSMPRRTRPLFRAIPWSPSRRWTGFARECSRRESAALRQATSSRNWTISAGALIRTGNQLPAPAFTNRSGRPVRPASAGL